MQSAKSSEQTKSGVSSQEEEKTVTFLGKKRKGICGSTLKIIAITTMFIDHIGAALLEPYLETLLKGNDYSAIYNSPWYVIYQLLRSIGRLGFPIFCFLLVEGFLYTRSKGKYIFRLALFCLISEVPFDLAFMHHVLEFSYQNVFFTLLIGMCVITVVDYIQHRDKMKVPVRYILEAVVIIAGCVGATLLRTDYGAGGILTITVMYFLRRHKVAEMYAGVLVLTLQQISEAYAFVATIPIALYNGKRGLKMKYFFYIFYPAHLLLLAGIAKLIGVA